MKKIWLVLLALLLLCTGCVSKTTTPLLQTADAARVDHVVMVPEWGGQPQETYTAKVCVNTADVRTIVQALQKVTLTDEVETIYGGNNTLFLLYQEETLVAKLYTTGDKVCIDGVFYACTGLPDTDKLYSSLSAKETDIVIA